MKLTKQRGFRKNGGLAAGGRSGKKLMDQEIFER